MHIISIERELRPSPCVVRNVYKMGRFVCDQTSRKHALPKINDDSHEHSGKARKIDQGGTMEELVCSCGTYG